PGGRRWHVPDALPVYGWHRWWFAAVRAASSIGRPVLRHDERRRRMLRDGISAERFWHLYVVAPVRVQPRRELLCSVDAGGRRLSVWNRSRRRRRWRRNAVSDRHDRYRNNAPRLRRRRRHDAVRAADAGGWRRLHRDDGARRKRWRWRGIPPSSRDTCVGI